MVSLFEHQDSQEFFERAYSLLMAEADRGCVLLGVSMLDEELTTMFKSRLLKDTSKSLKKEIFDGKGAFGTLSAKLDIAYVCQILPEDLVNCMHCLRKLRNNLAHQASPFTIQENSETIFNILNKISSGNLFVGIANMSGELVVQAFLQKIMDTSHPLDEGKKLFESQEEAISYLEQNDELKTTLVEKKIKTMFVIGIACLGALIIFHREKHLSMIENKA
ncbi:hypothetical protein SAMN05216333_1394 [Nitrosomonas oligotropha]|uniref:Uncharacterized protein n=2 Tax=Nitrosomonas oligotropha TaxID=42354 RepID=A0A1H8UQQ7_9PROT|nr:hypothetical protein SAMN05216300_1414 [Nitrosomonas oligotropha]SEP05343.1 hypothetical protein SAMN05216333_1394 [Nitrosomonas oligotropha]